MNLLFFLLLLLLNHSGRLQPAQSLATPYIGSIDPPYGSDMGGYTVTISGRNLGFLDIDCSVKMGSRMASNIRVTDSWDKMEATVPGCPMCAKVDLSVTCNGVESNKVPFLMTNECYGPLLGSSQPELPKSFSARENCTVCMDLIQLTMAAVADTTSYQGLQSAMQQSCYTPHFKKWLQPGTKCELNLVPACRLMLGTSGDLLLDTMWNLWDDGDNFFFKII